MSSFPRARARWLLPLPSPQTRLGGTSRGKDVIRWFSVVRCLYGTADWKSAAWLARTGSRGLSVRGLVFHQPSASELPGRPVMTTAQAKPITGEEVRRLFEELSNWGRWGKEDQRGALNYITPEKRRAAAALVKEGVTVSAALPLAKTPAVDNPTPVSHFMIRAGDVAGATSSADYFAIAPHGMANTHLDA